MMEEYTEKDAIMNPNEAGDNKGVSLFLRFLVVCFSLLFWVIGALFCSIGCYVVSQWTSYAGLSDLATGPGVIVIVLGATIFVVSMFGVLGALRQNIRLLWAYKVFLMAALVLQVFCGFVTAAFWPEVRKVIDSNIAQAIRTYQGGDSVVTNSMIDMLQRQLQCCGSLGIDDWDSNLYYSCRHVEGYRSCGVPWSCCLQTFYRNRHCGLGLRKDRNNIDLEKHIYTVGCMDKAFMLFKDHTELIVAFALTCVVPLICGIFMIHVFMKQIMRQFAKEIPPGYENQGVRTSEQYLPNEKFL